MSLPTKRSTCSAASASTDSSYSSPTMKKAKNGLHTPPSSHPNADDKVGFPMEEDPTPAAANLSRKKATLPQPTKKLVIKLNKGFFFLFFRAILISIVIGLFLGFE